jgi:rhodanese-related sulfurtransferase
MTEADLDPRDVAQRLEQGWLLVDVRRDDERADVRIAGDLHIVLDQLTARVDEIDAGRPLVFYCHTGSRSAMATQAFRASGFDAHNLAGGIEAWENAGLPVDRG